MCNKKYLSKCIIRLNHNPGPLSQFTDEEILMKESGNFCYYQIFINKLFFCEKQI